MVYRKFLCIMMMTVMWRSGLCCMENIEVWNTLESRRNAMLHSVSEIEKCAAGIGDVSWLDCVGQITKRRLTQELNGMRSTLCSIENDLYNVDDLMSGEGVQLFLCDNSRTLNFSRNFLYSLHGFSGLQTVDTTVRNITKLNISGNKLKYLPFPTIFSSCPELQELDASNNEISHLIYVSSRMVDLGAIPRGYSFKSLTLRNNQLTTFPLDQQLIATPFIELIDVSDNSNLESIPFFRTRFEQQRRYATSNLPVIDVRNTKISQSKNYIEFVGSEYRKKICLLLQESLRSKILRFVCATTLSSTLLTGEIAAGTLNPADLLVVGFCGHMIYNLLQSDEVTGVDIEQLIKRKIIHTTDSEESNAI